jgi:hypothetical protein
MIRALLSKLSALAAPDPLLLEFDAVARSVSKQFDRADLGRDIDRIVKYRVRRVRDGYDSRAQLMLLRGDVMRIIPSAEIAKARMQSAGSAR